MIDLSIIGLNHKSAPVSIRERFAFDAEQLSAAIATVRPLTEEIVVLCTCNRTEFIFRPGANQQHLPIQTAITALANVPGEDVQQYLYVHHGRQALVHLFRVAAGLDSMVVGEAQILGQFKDAFEWSIQRGLVANNFHHIYQQTLAVAKKVRTRTKLGEGSVSVGAVAVQLACNIFGAFFDKAVLLIGAGEMCEIAGEQFVQNGVGRILVANRSPEKAAALARNWSGTAYGLDDLPTAITQADIVLASVADQKNLITAAMIAEAMKGRANRPLFIVDIAVPRNVDERVNDVADVYLYNIDDLQKLVDNNLRDRTKEAVKGETIVQREADAFLAQRVNGNIAGPLIQSLQERVTLIKNAELTRLYNRNPGMTREERGQVEQTVNAIVNKILHDPIISLRRELKNQSNKSNIVAVFKDFFNL